MVSAVLFFNSTYFGSVLATNIALIVFLLFGIVGLNTEIEKYTNKSLDLNASELLGAVLFLGPWYYLQLQPHHWGWNILYVILLLFGIIFAVRWIMSLGSRFVSAIKVDDLPQKLKAGVLILTQIAAIVGIVVKIMQSIKLL